MTRYEQAWCDALVAGVDGLDEPMQVLFVVTDTSEGKVAFVLTFDDDGVTATAGKLPRGQKAAVTVTAKEAVLLELWAGNRSRDAAFMRGDLKVEGAYERWLDQLVPLFSAGEWAARWQAAAA